MDKEFRKPTVHSMKRRCNAHDYSRSGLYHITICVAKALRQPLGRMAGKLEKPDGDIDAPHVELSAIGQMVEKELRESITKYYPMLEVLDYVIMPEHLHFILVAHSNIISRSGKATHLGHVIAGFKYGCNKRYWAMTGRISLATELPGAVVVTKSSGAVVEGDLVTELPGAVVVTKSSGAVVEGDLVTESPGAVVVTKSSGAVGKGDLATELPGAVVVAESPDAVGAVRVLDDSVVQDNLPPLFDGGYCDVMPLDELQLDTQRAYIRANPRNRLLRDTYRAQLHPQRLTVDTAVSLPALLGYLKRECPRQIVPSAWEELEKRLLQKDDRVVCDSYGSLVLLRSKLLPVVCHRRDAALFEQQKAHCLAEAAAGAVLVSARISKGEQEIMDSALLSGFPVIRIEDNGFPEIYHPSGDRINGCATGKLLLLTPWHYRFRTREESITVPFCKTMNCIAQAICRTKDDWWKNGQSL